MSAARKISGVTRRERDRALGRAHDAEAAAARARTDADIRAARFAAALLRASTPRERWIAESRRFAVKAFREAAENAEGVARRARDEANRLDWIWQSEGRP